MKKTLYLIRHATAEEGGNSSMFRDFDRELTSTGIIESARMAKFLTDAGVKFDLIVSSEAVRAKNTAKIFAEQLHHEVDSILLDENIYGGGPRAYLAATNGFDEKYSTVAIFGHNPDISFFGEYLTRADIGGSMDKAGVLILEFEEQLWANISSKSGQLVGYHSPRTISGQSE